MSDVDAQERCERCLRPLPHSTAELLACPQPDRPVLRDVPRLPATRELTASDDVDAAVDVAAIKARVEAATPGPWFREYGDVVTGDDDPRDWFEDEPRNARVVRRAEHRDMRDPQAIADAEFAARARTDVPTLLAEVLRLREAVEKVQAKARVWKWSTNPVASDLGAAVLAALSSVSAAATNENGEQR